jgi:putative flippase GtrA
LPAIGRKVSAVWNVGVRRNVAGEGVDKAGAFGGRHNRGNREGVFSAQCVTSRLYLRGRDLLVSESEQLRVTKRPGWVEWIVDHFPPGQFGRYLAVGVANTAFGYGTYAGLTALFTPHIPFAYMLASVISGFINISFAFLNYKWFIFKTKGSYFREWSRCVVVYGSTMATGTVILPFTVFLVRHLTQADKSAPYIAGGLQISANVIAGFLGHKHFSFAKVDETGTV